jgi:hypothetical protein
MLFKSALYGLVVLALGAGVAFASTRSTTAAGLDVCVNNATGVMRLSTDCRDSEHPVALGGSGNATATQNGVFSVAAGTTGGSKALPLTGLVLSGRCDIVPPEGGGGTLARPLIEAATGRTLDGFGQQSTSVIGSQTLLLVPVAFVSPIGGTGGGLQTAIVTSNGATATLTFGGFIDQTSGACRFLWQAVEVANS